MPDIEHWAQTGRRSMFYVEIYNVFQGGKYVLEKQEAISDEKEAVALFAALKDARQAWQAVSFCRWDTEGGAYGSNITMRNLYDAWEPMRLIGPDRLRGHSSAQLSAH